MNPKRRKTIGRGSSAGVTQAAANVVGKSHFEAAITAVTRQKNYASHGAGCAQANRKTPLTTVASSYGVSTRWMGHSQGRTGYEPSQNAAA
ncbi:hypothetical protein MRX96_015858 [Rhipicephalus microplus]